MLISKSFWIGRHLPRLSPDNDGGGGPAGPSGATAATAATGASGSTGATGATEDVEDVEGLNENGKAALKRLWDQREAARTEATTAKEERDALLKEKTEREAAEQKHKDEEAAKAGKWEELATKREGDLKSAKDEVTRLTGENDQFRQAMKVGVEALWKDLPEALKLAGKFIGEDDILARWTYLHDADVQKQITEANKADPKRGNGRDPKSTGDGQPEIKSLIPKAAFLG